MQALQDHSATSTDNSKAMLFSVKQGCNKEYTSSEMQMYMSYLKRQGKRQHIP